MRAGLRPQAKARELPPDATARAPVLDSTCVTKGVLDLKMKVLSAELSVHRGSDLGEWRRQRRRPKPRENRPPWAVMQTGRP